MRGSKKINKALRRIVSYSVIVAASIWALLFACIALGARINTTKSIPLGLYWASSALAAEGAYVMFCPPQRGVFDEAKRRGYIGVGWCPGNYSYMMKRILAAKGDSVSVSDDGVRVNDKLLPNSAPHEADKLDRPLPHYRTKHYVLSDSEVLLMSDVSATSFDGRYFGPIHRPQIKTVIRPIFTW
jgi:conjugative transfer signal peptidase TraF